MAKPKIPNQKAKYKALNARLNKYTLLVQAAVATFITEAVNSLYMVDYDGTEAFSFDSNPITKGQLSEKRSNFITRLFGLFLTGTALEWAESNKVQDTVADKVLSAYGGKKIEGFYQDNNDKLRAFQSRVYSGRTTYDRLGEIANAMQKEVETAVSVSGGSPIPIVQTKVEQYFSDVDSLRKDFKKKFGYEPHVQDSQYQAARLLRSEINMAYRTAEQERWKQIDFVVGYEIKLSATHHDRMPKGDICDTLAGKYPKWFKWSGWHPGDLCYAIPILKTEDEFFNDLPSENQVTDVPRAMKDWLERNREYVFKASKNGSLPYWISDNMNMLSSSMPSFNLIDDILSVFGTSSPKFQMVSDYEAIKAVSDVVAQSKGLTFGKFNGIRADSTLGNNVFGGHIPIYKDNIRYDDIFINNKNCVATGVDGIPVVFNPWNEFKGALYAIRNNIQLTFNQEYAVENVWHELLHSSTRLWKGEVADIAVASRMELVNQFCARRTYDSFLKKLGGEATHQETIITSGYGYKDVLSGFENFLSNNGLSADDAFRFFVGKIRGNFFENIADLPYDFLRKNKKDSLLMVFNEIFTHA